MKLTPYAFRSPQLHSDLWAQVDCPWEETLCRAFRVPPWTGEPPPVTAEVQPTQPRTATDPTPF